MSGWRLAWRIWAWPVLVAITTGAGLLSALVGDGLADVVSWLLLAWPLALALWFGVAWRKPPR